MQNWVDIHEPKRMYGGPDCLMGEYGMPSKWDGKDFGSRGEEERTKGAPPQDNTERCWTLLASGVIFLAEEVEKASLSYRGGGERLPGCPKFKSCHWRDYFSPVAPRFLRKDLFDWGREEEREWGNRVSEGIKGTFSAACFGTSTGDPPIAL